MRAEQASWLTSVSVRRRLPAFPDHRLRGRVVTAAADGSVRISNCKLPRLAALVLTNSSAIGCLAFSPDGKRLLTAAPRSGIRLWEANGGTSLDETSNPLVNLLVISRRNTPDLVHGSRNFTVWSAQRFAPLRFAAHASVSVSSIRFASSGGVNTSSLERFAIHVRTSGLRKGGGS